MSECLAFDRLRREKVMRDRLDARRAKLCGGLLNHMWSILQYQTSMQLWVLGFELLEIMAQPSTDIDDQDRIWIRFGPVAEPFVYWVEIWIHPAGPSLMVTCPEVVKTL